MKLTEDQVNDLLRYLNDSIPIFKNKIVLSKNTHEEVDGDELFEVDSKDFFLPLMGYTVKREEDGDHKNDGQMVEYTFTLTSPKKKTTVIVTEMCLEVGWNYHESLTIK